MNPAELGIKYDKIAQWWHDRHHASAYGVTQFQCAISMVVKGGKALDVGCGAGGRFVRILEQHEFAVTGLDVSKEMVNLARENHPQHHFIHQDICTWETSERFDFIVAWDSIFHLPLAMQKPVISKLCGLLASGGVLMYTFGDDEGDHTDQWHNDTIYYNSIGIQQNVQLLLAHGLALRHLEIDQYPAKHVYVIASNRSNLIQSPQL